MDVMHEFTGAEYALVGRCCTGDFVTQTKLIRTAKPLRMLVGKAGDTPCGPLIAFCPQALGILLAGRLR